MIRYALGAAALCLAAPAFAQTARPTLDYASAAKIRDTCIAWATERNMKVAIWIMEPHGMPVALAHMDGVSAGVNEIARWKANSAAHFGRASGDAAGFTPPPNTPNIASIGGGVPIYSADGVLLGGVGTSGGKVADDIACGVAGIEAAGLKSARPQPAQ